MDLSESTLYAHRHPWEMSRADFMMSTIERHIGLGPGSELLDIGAGDLFFSHQIHHKTGVKIDAVDSAFDEEDSRNAAIQKIKDLARVTHKRYDAICAMDVLEHVEDDVEFIKILLALLKPGASLFLTVPAYQYLFSQHDINLRHFRRYTASRVLGLLKDMPQELQLLREFEVRENFYFYHTLFYVRFIQKAVQWTMRQLGKVESRESTQFKSINSWQFAEHHPLTRGLGGVLGLDAWFCRALSRLGVRLPGLSLCLVIRRKV
jgi:SAM-dependent methyltransferase